jgi:hypothetical protein
MDGAGTLTTLHTLTYGAGSYPWAGLIQASDGSFYDTTRGGANDGGVVIG